MNTSISIIRATPDRLPVLAGVLGRAFVDDPMIQWPLGGAGTIELVTEMFGLLYAGPVQLGMVWEAGDGAGVAAWVPPGAGEQLWESDRVAREVWEPKMPDGGGRYRDMWGWLESMLPEDVWYLDAIGVDPALQRTGIGGALVRHGLALAEADRVGAFLETSQATNVPYYERFGFRVVDEGDAPGGGPHIWFMRRDP